MQDDKKRRNEEPKKGLNKFQRGTSDDFEVLKLVVENDANLRRKVLEKIRIMRAMRGESALDAARKQHETQKKGESKE